MFCTNQGRLLIDWDLQLLNLCQELTIVCKETSALPHSFMNQLMFITITNSPGFDVAKSNKTQLKV